MIDYLLSQPGINRLRGLVRRHANARGAAFAFVGFVAVGALLYAMQDMSSFSDRRRAADIVAFSQAFAMATDAQAVAAGNVVRGDIDNGWLFLTRQDGAETAARIPDFATDVISRLFVEAATPITDGGARTTVGGVFGMLFTVGLIALLGRYAMTMTGVGRTIGAPLWVDEITTRFSDVAGADEARRDLLEFARMIRGEVDYGAVGARTPKGVLLAGPPGTGKTLLARATAGEGRVNFIACAGGDFGGMLVGQGARDVGQLMATARRMAPCIVFIDEIDAVGKKRGQRSHDDYETTLTKLLAEMDGVSPSQGVFFLAATNHVEALDAALTRPGRFDRIVQVPLPDIGARRSLLRIHTRQLALAEGLDLDDVAVMLHGVSGAQIEVIANEAAIQAGRAGAARVARGHFEAAVMKVAVGERIEGAPLPAREREQVAYHEAGHAVLALTDPLADPVHRVTIVQYGQTFGHVASQPAGDVRIMSEAALLTRLRCLAGGRAGEIVGLGPDTRSTLAAADIAEVSRLALEMTRHWAMVGEDAFFAEPDGGVLDRVSDVVLTDARLVASTALRQACDRLQDNRAGLVALAQALLRDETIDGSAARTIVETATDVRRSA
jgi:cell division protease FtsH